MGRRKKEIIIEKHTVADFTDFTEVFEYLVNQLDMTDAEDQLNYIKDCMNEDMWIELCSNIRDNVAESQSAGPEDEFGVALDDDI